MKYELLKDVIGDIKAGKVYTRTESGEWVSPTMGACTPWLNGFFEAVFFDKTWFKELEETVLKPIAVDLSTDSTLNPKQSAHRQEVVQEAAQLIHDKYTVGAKEHNTNLKEDTTVHQLVDFALEEAIDQMVYLITLKQKIDEEW